MVFCRCIIYNTYKYMYVQSVRCSHLWQHPHFVWSDWHCPIRQFYRAAIIMEILVKKTDLYHLLDRLYGLWGHFVFALLPGFLMCFNPWLNECLFLIFLWPTLFCCLFLFTLLLESWYCSIIGCSLIFRWENTKEISNDSKQSPQWGLGRVYVDIH